jgi:hypothetical protein
MDWNSILAEVQKEVTTVEREGDYPDIRFANLKDGVRIPAETELRVEVDATDGDGIRELKLYLNGLLLKSHETQRRVWSGWSDELLKSLKPGMYRLEAVAEDNTGIFARQEIQIAVGDVSENSEATGSDEPHQVILNEGELLTDGDARQFPRLECYLFLNEDGRLVLNRGVPGRSILLITADDMNWDSVGVYGCPVEETTPNIDRLSSEGIQFDYGYVQVAVCTPSRQVMLSGSHSHQTMTRCFTELERVGPALPDVLKQNCYHIANINKQQDFYGWDTAIDETESVNVFGNR